jgi:hypothetical protein
MIRKTHVEKLDVDLIDMIESLNEEVGHEILAPFWKVVEKAMNANIEPTKKDLQDNIFFGISYDFIRLTSNGKVSSFQLGLFEQLVRMRYHDSNVHFDILSFERQALLELNAVRFAYDPVTIFNNIEPPDSLSCDYYSCLLAYGTSRPHTVISIETDLKEALSMAASVGEASTLLWWEEHIRNNPILKEHANKARDELYHGNLVGITMAAHAANSAVMESRPELMLNVEGLLSSCSHFLEHVVLSEEFPTSPSASSNLVRSHDEHDKMFITTLSIKRLMIILEEVVDPQSRIYFQQPLNAADALRISWPLGAALAFPWSSS